LGRRRGRSEARNAGIASARGRWIAFCDDDDIWAPDKLARQISTAVRAGARWVYSGEVVVDDTLRVLYGAPPPDPDAVVSELPRFNAVPAGASNVVVESQLVAEVGGFDPALCRVEDWDLWLRIARRAPPACVSEPALAYRAHFGAWRVDVAPMVREPEVLMGRYGIAVDRCAMLRRAGWACLQAGRRADAARLYGRAAVRGDLGSIARAGIALLDPRVGDPRIYGLLRRHADPAWMARAEPWLRVARVGGAPHG
jgi:glycosyltransferase involved in cell wall biosynthesis